MKFRDYYLIYILICMVYHFYNVARAYRKGGAKSGVTENTTIKQFDAVKYMREQRDKLSQKSSKMTKTEIVEYFKNRKQKRP